MRVDLCHAFGLAPPERTSVARRSRKLPLLALLISVSAAAQMTTSGLPTAPVSAVVPVPLAEMTTTLQQAQNPIFGSVPQGPVVPGVLPLTALDAIDRGLKYNLSLLLSTQATESARGARLRALADVLPNLKAQIAESEEQLSSAQFGLSGYPGFPSVIKPFHLFDARFLLSAPALDLHSLNLLHARSDDVSASRLDYQNARDLVVLVVGGTYMQALADMARIASVEAQLKTAQTLYQQASDMKSAGVVAGIDVLRSQVEMQVQQQRLLAARNEFAKEKLTLARLIGLPTAQEFSLAEDIPFRLAPPITLEMALERALRERPDYQSAKLELQSAEMEHKAAVGEALPSLRLNADYGALGTSATHSHGTFTTVGALQIPIFQGGKVRGDLQRADALISQRRSQLDDLRGRIEYEVRTALLDLSSTAEQVQVAHSSMQLAQETLNQAQDRFRAGVTNNVEVVQAQEALAATNENYINSTFSYNVAKLSLVRALGEAERAVKDFLGGKQ